MKLIKRIAKRTMEHKRPTRGYMIYDKHCIAKYYRQDILFNKRFWMNWIFSWKKWNWPLCHTVHKNLFPVHCRSKKGESDNIKAFKIYKKYLYKCGVGKEDTKALESKGKQ